MAILTKALRLYRTEVRHLAFWRPKDSELWRRRASVIYAASVWTLIGLLAYTQWRKKDPETDQDPETLSDVEKEPLWGRKQKFTFESSIQYKENHTPYTTRLYEYFTSSNKPSSSGSSEN